MSKRIQCGYEITATPKRVSSDGPPHVRLFKMGGHDAHYMTPEEARMLAKALVGAAEDAEKS